MHARQPSRGRGRGKEDPNQRSLVVRPDQAQNPIPNPKVDLVRDQSLDAGLKIEVRPGIAIAEDATLSLSQDLDRDQEANRDLDPEASPAGDREVLKTKFLLCQG